MYFPTTQWSVLARASLNGETAGRQALEDLCNRYWSPLFQFIRARGYSEPEAQDLTQEFLLHLLEHSTLKKADPQRGRFRSFLLGALGRFLSDEHDRRLAKKRGSGAAHISLEAEGPQVPAPAEDRDLGFDREWALVVLENALGALEAEFVEAAGAVRFAVLRRFLPGSTSVPGYEEAAARLQMSLPALKSELYRVRQRFKTLVRQEVANTVSAPHEIEEEMNHLQEVLMHKGHDFGATLKPLAAIS